MSSRSLLWPIALGSAVGVLTGVALNARAGKAPSSDYRFFDELVEVKALLASRYVVPPDEDKMREGAIRGMVEALDDPYTVYVPASEQRDFSKSLTGEYVGIGAQVNTSTGWLTIVSPLEDAPAFRAGLMPDDRVIEIDGASTQRLDVERCVDLLSGRPGTQVKLLIDRNGARFDVTLTREKIKTRSVKGVHRDPANPQSWDYLIDPDRRIAYIRVTQFTPGVADEVAAALASVGASKGQLGALVLDLRFNPGGLLSEAERIADLFLREGVIVSTRGRAYEERVSRAESDATLPDFPLVVMLNSESASASEVLAGALVENNRAIVLGTRSYGKGSVQVVVPLREGGGSELKLTEQGYFLPSGRSITRNDDSPTWGVDPSPGFYVPMSDKQLGEVLTVRRKLELLHSAPPSGAVAPPAEQPATPAQTAEELRWEDPAWVLDYLKDTQLAAAVRAAQARLDAGSWQPVGESPPDQSKAVAMEELQRTREFQERLLRELVRAERRLDALSTVAGQDTPNPRDFWPDDTKLSGGSLEVRDKDGNLVATLSITGNNLERWLLDADVEKK
jgi:carboxyl-terminal processing protease